MENLDSIIIQRLGEHHRKSEFIKRHNSSHHKYNLLRPISYGVISAAACIAIIMFFSPHLFKPDPFSNISISEHVFDGYRSASEKQIEDAIQSCDFETALHLTNLSIEKSEKEINYLTSLNKTDSETEFLIIVETENLEYLYQKKFHILIKLKKKDEFIATCNKYLSANYLYAFKDEIRVILEKIK